MHDLVSRTTYARFHGVSVARDFIEAPSQMLENWRRIPSYLAALSSHFETGEPIPHDMLEGLIDANRDKSALNTIDQLAYAIFDMAIDTYPICRDVGALEVVHSSVIKCLDRRTKETGWKSQVKYRFQCPLPASTPSSRGLEVPKWFQCGFHVWHLQMWAPSRQAANSTSTALYR